MNKLILTLSFVIFLGACQTKPPMSAQERRALQVRTFNDVSYSNVFRAFKTVLQDEGYIVKTQDMQGGLIVAKAQKKAGGIGFFSVFGGNNNNYKLGETFEVSVNLEEISKNTVESRVIVQKEESYSRGGSVGNEIVAPGLYKNIYQKVQVEVERRKAKGR